MDGGKARVILNALVAPSEVTENRPMLDLFWRTCFRWELRPRHVTGDAKYGTHENVAGIERAGTRAYVALPNFDFRRTEGGFFGPGHFRYDPGRDAYVCPAGELMHRRARNSGPRGTMYRAPAEACNACELKKRCTDSKNGRTVYRPRDEGYYDRVRAYRGTFPYEKALRKRKVWIEPLFAEAKDWHGMRRFRLRRLEKVNVESLLVASGQNVKRLLAFGSRGPRKPAQAAALRPPTTAGPVTGLARELRHGRRCRPAKAFSTGWSVYEARPSGASENLLRMRDGVPIAVSKSASLGRGSHLGCGTSTSRNVCSSTIGVTTKEADGNSRRRVEPSSGGPGSGLSLGRARPGGAPSGLPGGRGEMSGQPFPVA